MATTIELFGITAEVPEGHEDFNRDSYFIRSPPFIQDYPLKTLFEGPATYGNEQIRRQCVDAARCWFLDQAARLVRIEEAWFANNAAIQEMQWRRIGEKAEEEAK